MFEIGDRLLAAVTAGKRLAVATAVVIDGSAPRTVGTSMAFDGTTVIGSIAGGCVEGAVIETCELVLADGIPRTVEYGVSDESAFSVGLTCGGQLRIHVQLLDDELIGALRGQRSLEVCAGFIEHPPVDRHLIVFGAMEFSAALSAAAQVLGYRVTLCDPRALFATPERFPGAEIIVAWPTVWFETARVNERTVICVLSHDARFDAELIALALGSPAAFVGAMGSRRTHDRRIASLRERGVSEEAIVRLRSPIGLDLGASSVEETAIAILAEVIAARSEASARPLSVTSGAIHPAPVLAAVATDAVSAAASIAATAATAATAAARAAATDVATVPATAPVSTAGSVLVE
ncbi:XdhC family protein [Frigoribacterium sp. CG_9.8]|uniref:XdhC family protein n=1 Tax=Frigoribacterium sp. CG_9.8 TaxID=2787733 RepID=UPI0018CA1347|nr:XdhC/CoxI family protein [Frigoribacterium sp. CG_9.8]MBG6106871.1 xanthine dehydrogenase accessory factor [Frigoribacterium sp. CG_9.8]